MRGIAERKEEQRETRRANLMRLEDYTQEELNSACFAYLAGKKIRGKHLPHGFFCT